MTVITIENFDDEGFIADGPTIDFVREQAELVDGHRAQLSLNPVMRFYGASESEAMMRAARWSEKNVDGKDVVVVSTWFRFIDEDLEDDLPYECGLLLDVM